MADMFSSGRVLQLSMKDVSAQSGAALGRPSRADAGGSCTRRRNSAGCGLSMVEECCWRQWRDRKRVEMMGHRMLSNTHTTRPASWCAPLECAVVGWSKLWYVFQKSRQRWWLVVCVWHKLPLLAFSFLPPNISTIYHSQSLYISTSSSNISSSLSNYHSHRHQHGRLGIPLLRQIQRFILRLKLGHCWFLRGQYPSAACGAPRRSRQRHHCNASSSHCTESPSYNSPVDRKLSFRKHSFRHQHLQGRTQPERHL